MDLLAKKQAIEEEIAEKLKLQKQAQEQAKQWADNAVTYGTIIYGLQQKLQLLNELIKETDEIIKFKSEGPDKEPIIEEMQEKQGA